MGFLNISRGPSFTISIASSQNKSRSTSSLSSINAEEKVDFVLTEKNDGWKLVLKGGKHNSNQQNFISSTKNFSIQTLDDDLTVRLLTPVKKLILHQPPLLLHQLLFQPTRY